jgi:hypothetical protein
MTSTIQHAAAIINALIEELTPLLLQPRIDAMDTNVNRRDETTEWTRIIRPLLGTGREPSERSRPA